MKNTESKKGATFKVTGNWAAQSKELKAQFPKLTDADLKCEIGKETEMLNRLESKLKKNREEVIAIIKRCQTEKV